MSNSAIHNLAQNPAANHIIRFELELCGIEVQTIEVLSGPEAAYNLSGWLDGFEFTRHDDYWEVKGNLPLTVAEELFEHPVGKTDILLDGRTDGTPPRHHAVWLDDNGLEARPPGPTGSGKQLITSCRVISTTGLWVLVDKLREHGLVEETVPV